MAFVLEESRRWTVADAKSEDTSRVPSIMGDVMSSRSFNLALFRLETLI